MSIRATGFYFLPTMIIVGVLLLLSPRLIGCNPETDAKKKTVLVSDLRNQAWNIEHCTLDQKNSLLAQWMKTEQSIDPLPKEVARLYNLLGDNSFDLRQSASKELALLGDINLEELQRLSKEDNDMERSSRAKQIIAQWLEERDTNIILIRNIFSVWKSSPHEQKLKYVKQLVNTIHKFPLQALQNELFLKLVNELKSHKTPEANLMLRSFLREDSTVLVLHTITLIGYPDKDFDFAPDLIRLAEGKDKAVALRALSNLSDWYSNREHVAEITSMIKRLYASKDAEVILQAAILSCRYSSDWSGFPMLLEATKKPDKKIALKAIEQLSNIQYRSYAKEVVPLLIPHLQTKDLNLLEHTIRTFGNYNDSAKHILPLLQHNENYIVNSTIIALNLMEAIEAIAPLEDLLQKTIDDTTRDCINSVLLSLKQLQQKH